MTVAPGTTAPLESWARPKNVAVVTCASNRSVGASMRKAVSRGTNVKVVRMLEPPRERVTLKENS